MKRHRLSPLVLLAGVALFSALMGMVAAATGAPSVAGDGHAVAWLPLYGVDRSTPGPTPTPTSTPTPRVSIRALQPIGQDEYIEVYNAGPGSQPLAGWRLHSVVGDQWYDFPPTLSLLPAGWVQVHSGEGAFEAPPQHLKWGSGYIWNNDGDEAELIDDRDMIVDRWIY